MATRNKFAGDETNAALRKEGGAFVKKLRNQREMTQRELAERVGLQYYTFLSQIESGSCRVPPQLYSKFAEALDVDTAEFVMTLMQFYDPHTYRALRGSIRRKIDWEALKREA